EIVPVYLDFHGHLIQMIDSVYIYHKLIADFRNPEQDMFNLGWEHIDATDNQHIVASSTQPCDLFPPAAEAPVFHEHGDITGPVAYERHGLFYQRCYHHLAPFPIGKTLAGFWIDDFYQEAVMPDMEAVPPGAKSSLMPYESNAVTPRRSSRVCLMVSDQGSAPKIPVFRLSRASPISSATSDRCIA